jgi:hypothetical protein
MALDGDGGAHDRQAGGAKAVVGGRQGVGAVGGQVDGVGPSRGACRAIRMNIARGIVIGILDGLDEGAEGIAIVDDRRAGRDVKGRRQGRRPQSAASNSPPGRRNRVICFLSWVIMVFSRFIFFIQMISLPPWAKASVK